MRTDLFQSASVPAHHTRVGLTRSSQWLTWSDKFRGFLVENAAQLRRLRPVLRRVRGAEPYDETYSTRLPASLRPALITAARDLARLQPEVDVLLFRNMIDGVIDRSVVHTCFALLRTAMVAIGRDSRSVLHSPVPTTRGKANDFQLHADLFAATRLWLVFDDVPSDGSGATILLPLLELERLLPTVPGLPSPERVRLRRLLSGHLTRDGFDELFDLLHGRNPWQPALAQRMAERQSVIRFAHGEGYLCNDRRWLHGREPVSGVVRSRRFHRLVF